MKSDKSAKRGNGNLGSMKRTLESNLIKMIMQWTPPRSKHPWSIKLCSGGHTFERYWPIQQALKGAVWMGKGRLWIYHHLINLWSPQEESRLFSLEWQRLWGMRNADLKYLSGHQVDSVVDLAYLSTEQIWNDWMRIPRSRPGPFPRRLFLKKTFTQG